MPKMEKPYKPHELALLLRKSDDGIRKLLQRGDIKGVKIGRQWRIPYDEVCRICKEDSNEAHKTSKSTNTQAEDTAGQA